MNFTQFTPPMDPQLPSDAAAPQSNGDEKSYPVWGAFSTLGWSILIAIAFVVVQVLVTGAFLLRTNGDPGDKMRAALEALKFNGTFLALCTFATCLVCTPLILGIVKLKRGATLKDYLGLRLPLLKSLLASSVIVLAVCFLSDAISRLLGKATLPEFMLKSYESASPRWLLWLALVVAAPVFEEICFRGFMFRGIAASRIGWRGATIVTAILWALIHLQYDWYETFIVFALGLVLGVARALTNSTILTIWLHGLINALATVQVAWALA
jgi:membrane protease YdiL (CAAX protease family)